MLICIDAGHGRNTSGKRCLKSIDPNETREWLLNSRIADKVQVRLAAYNCSIMRVDDTTGQEDVALAKRVKLANEAGADVYLSIHHNAGINGGSGGGIVIYAAPGASERSRALQEALYEHAVAATGLRGNRANPTAESNLFVLRNTKMPAVLGEFGFMDSTTDTPIILTEDYADHLADGIVVALVETFNLGRAADSLPLPSGITPGEFDALMEGWLARQAAKNASSWSKMSWAAQVGITDGTRPQSFATREEAATMIKSALDYFWRSIIENVCTDDPAPKDE